MNHPRINTAKLSDETIKALAETLFDRWGEEKKLLEQSETDSDRAIIIGRVSATLREYKKIQRFMDR